MAATINRCVLVMCGLLWITTVCDSLNCYSCHYQNQAEVCTNTQITCDWGQVCLNVVYRHQLYGVVYTKGCKFGRDCYALQDLNDDNYCKNTPSECAYCCDTDLCNDANIPMTSFTVLIFSCVTARLMRGNI